MRWTLEFLFKLLISIVAASLLLRAARKAIKEARKPTVRRASKSATQKAGQAITKSNQARPIMQLGAQPSRKAFSTTSKKAITEARMRSFVLRSEIGRAINIEAAATAAQMQKRQRVTLTDQVKSGVRKVMKEIACLYLDKSLAGKEPTQQERSALSNRLSRQHSKIDLTANEIKSKGAAISTSIESRQESKDKAALTMAVKLYCDLR